MMIKAMLKLLGDEAPVFRRYVVMALLTGVLTALLIAAMVPALGHLLRGDSVRAAGWLLVLIPGAIAVWQLRRRVERAGLRVGIAILGRGRLRLGDHVAGLPVGWFDSENAGRLNHAITQGMPQIAQLPAHVFTPILCGIAVPPVLAVVLFALDWRIGLAALLALPVVVLIFLTAARLGRETEQGFHDAAVEAGQRALEFAQSQSVLRAFGGDGSSTRFLHEAIANQRNSALRLIRQSVISTVLSGWFVGLVYAAMILIAVMQLTPDIERETGISLILAMVLATRFCEPLSEIAGYADAIRSAQSQLEIITDFLAVPPLPAPAQPQTPRDASVALKNIRFRYGPEGPDILRDVSLYVPEGSMTALIGASGSGKSTVLRIVSRFFDVSGGEVSIGGVDVRDMSQAELTDQISQIFQDSYLFSGTIADNIRMARPDASEAELREVVRLSGVSEIIKRLPDGLDSATGEGGVRLSGGERQRITIARALLKDAPILLVDEATAALDAENMALITDTLARLRGKRTLIVIAHQLSTVQMADQIAVLENGTIAESGSPAQLAASGGAYARYLNQRHQSEGWRLGAQV